MSRVLSVLGVTLMALTAITATASDIEFKVKSLDGKEVDLAKKYAGKVLLVVNVASECGLTPQYEDLQALHEKYSGKGLCVLGFPCNQFGKQEPGTASEIREFCTTNYGVKFDLFEKIEVNGEGANPFYKHLTAVKTKPQAEGKIGWNFEKFVIGKDGQVIARFSPRTSPKDAEVIKTIEDALAK